MVDAAFDAGSTLGDADTGDGSADADRCIESASAGANELAVGCPCAPGTPAHVCDPPDLRTVQNGVSGTIVCSEGTMYCRDAAWSECEILWQYATFVPD